MTDVCLLRSALSKYVPYLGVLLCVSGRDRFSSSSFQSTRRSTLTSQSESKGPARARNSSASESESVSLSVLSRMICRCPSDGCFWSPEHFRPTCPNRCGRSVASGSLLGHGGGLHVSLAGQSSAVHRRKTSAPLQPEVKGERSQRGEV